MSTDRPGPLCFFSKHLPKLAPGPMAKALRAAGYEGIELTVRPIDLPEVLNTIRDEAQDRATANQLNIVVNVPSTRLGIRLSGGGTPSVDQRSIASIIARNSIEVATVFR